MNSIRIKAVKTGFFVLMPTEYQGTLIPRSFCRNPNDDMKVRDSGMDSNNGQNCSAVVDFSNNHLSVY